MASFLGQRFRPALSTLLGYVRAAYASLRGARVAKKVRIGPDCRFLRPWAVSFGERAEIEHGVYFKAVSDEARICFGSQAFVGAGCEFDVAQLVEVGERVLLAPGCFVTDHQHGIAGGKRIVDQGCTSRAVRIGNDSWIGAKAVILAGVSIGEGAVVGAGAVVTKDVAPWTIVVGVPARIIGVRQ
jgi:acetyltransferase-like isoleucine patch superfamily enzyme